MGVLVLSRIEGRCTYHRPRATPFASYCVRRIRTCEELDQDREMRIVEEVKYDTHKRVCCMQHLSWTFLITERFAVLGTQYIAL